MRFILRCIFWLSVVYSSILADVGGRTETGGRDIARAVRAAAVAPMNAVSGQAATGLSAYCRHDVGACLADSARLTALVAASADDASERDEAVPTSRLSDPRRRARGALPARMP